MSVNVTIITYIESTNRDSRMFIKHIDTMQVTIAVELDGYATLDAIQIPITYDIVPFHDEDLELAGEPYGIGLDSPNVYDYVTPQWLLDQIDSHARAWWRDEGRFIAMDQLRERDEPSND